MGIATCTPVRTCVLGKIVSLSQARISRFLQRTRHVIGQQNMRWKLEDWNTSINLHSDTALFTAFFLLQTLHLYENPPYAPAYSNFILALIQCLLAFKHHMPLKLGLFYSAFSTDTWPYLFRVSLAFAYDLHRRSRLPSSRASDDGMHGRGIKIIFSQYWGHQSVTKM